MHGPGVRPLIVTEHYWIREHVSDGGRVALVDLPETRVLLVTRGGVRVDGTPAGAGTTVVVPAETARATAVNADDGAGVLEVGLTPVEPSALAAAG
jgi:hypothetical protein